MDRVMDRVEASGRTPSRGVGESLEAALVGVMQWGPSWTACRLAVDLDVHSVYHGAGLRCEEFTGRAQVDSAWRW